jgi:hypothetical protein
LGATFKEVSPIVEKLAHFMVVVAGGLLVIVASYI